MSDASSRETSRGKGENTRRFAKQNSRDAGADSRHPQWWRRQTGITEQAAGMPSRQDVPLRRDTATGLVCAAGKLPSPDRSFPTLKLTRLVGFPVAPIVTVVRPRRQPGRPLGRPHSTSRGLRHTGGRRASPGSRRSRPSRSGSGRCSWARAYGSDSRLVAGSCWRAAQGCPCPLAGRSPRPSRPRLTACPLRFAILAPLAPTARSRARAAPRCSSSTDF